MVTLVKLLAFIYSEKKTLNYFSITRKLKNASPFHYEKY